MSVQLGTGGWEVRWRDGTGPPALASASRARRPRGSSMARFTSRRAERAPSGRRHGSSGGVYSVHDHQRARAGAHVSAARDGVTDEQARFHEREGRARRQAPADRAASSAARSATPGVVRGVLGALAGATQALPGAGHVAGAMRSTVACGCSPPSGAARSPRRRARRSAGWTSRPRRSRPASSRPKTVNNALGTLVVCLNAAVEDGLIAEQPGAAGTAAARRPHRARVPAPARDPALPRHVLRGLPAAGRAADR